MQRANEQATRAHQNGLDSDAAEVYAVPVPWNISQIHYKFFHL
jgi:hypothetical protein